MSRHMRAAFYMALLAIGCTLTLAPARAQSVYGSIFGTVTDTTGAVIPGATVTVTDEAKGTVVTATTNGTGDYSVTHLVPDNYDVKIEIQGFSSFVSKGVVVLADTAPRVDAALTVAGAGAQTVTVDADAVPVLKTDRADVSTVFDSQQVSDLPVGDQNFTNLQLLLPGAQLLGWSHAADENPQASRQIQVDGQAFGGVAYELDGTDNQDPILGIIVVNPSLDSVTEAKITTQNFDAELGKAVSAVMTVQTKSGSNTFHGSAYDFRTSNANLAREPFSQPPGSFFPPGLKNKFGGSVGGPVIKDRIFFFGSYEGQRQKVGTSEVNSLPSPLLTKTCLGSELGPSITAGCDFSEYYANLPGGPNNGPIANTPPTGTIYNNTGVAVLNTSGCRDWNGNIETGAVGAPFPCNVIPASLVSTQFKNILTELAPYTALESGGGLGGLDGNSKLGGTGLFNSDLWTVRGDATISQRMSAFGRFSRWTNTLSGAQMYGPIGGSGFGIGGYGGKSSSADDSAAAGMDFVLNPKLITDLRLGYLRYNINDQKNDQDVQAATALGIPGINLGTTITGGLPSMFGTTLNGGSHQPQYGDGLNISRCNCPLIEREDQFQVVNNWTKVFGNHSVKIGVDFRYGRNLRVPSDSDRAGILNFGTGPTSSAGANGLGFATMALGDVTSFNRYVSTSTNAKEFQKRLFFYAQDTWRATNKLTLNLGIRWEGYYPETVNGAGNGALLNLNDGYLHVAGIGGIGTNMGWDLDVAKQFEPRIGIAYQLNEKTVFRAGYGRSFDIGVFGSIFGHVVTQNLPVLANQSLSNSQNSTTGLAFCLGAASDNPGCNQSAISTSPITQGAGGGPIVYTPPAVPSNGLLPNPGYSVSTKARPNPLRFPTLDAWNMSFQRAITPTLSLTIAYVGNKGTHTLSDGDNNNTNPNEAAITLPGSFKIGNQTLSSINGQTLHWDPRPAGSPGITAGATSNSNYLQRYYGGALPACSDPAYVQPIDPNLAPGACGWSQGIGYYGDDQNTNFNAMQVTLTQHAWKGLAATFNYQWASAFDFNGGYATWSKSAVYGRDSNVRQNAATIYGTYDFPFGRGKQFLSGVNRVTDLLIGGYELGGTMNRSSGLPWTPNINCQFTYIGPDGLSHVGNDLPGGVPCYPNKTGARMKTGLTSFNPSSASRTFFQAQTLGGGIFSDAGLDNIGNNGRNTYWGPGFFNTDLSIQKSFQIWERVATKFRMDAYNAVNRINPSNPSTNVLSSGNISGEAPGPGPRYLEFSLKLTF